MVDATAWMDRALCTGADPEIWFPEAGGWVASRKAQKICRACPVREQCLEYALVNFIDHGIWGGIPGSVREKMRSERNLVKPREWSDPMEHGTTGAVARHQRAREPMCPLCQPVRNKMTTQWNAIRRARKRAARGAA